MLAGQKKQESRVGEDADFVGGAIESAGFRGPTRVVSRVDQTLVRLTVWQKMAWQPVTFRRPSPVMIIVPS